MEFELQQKEAQIAMLKEVTEVIASEYSLRKVFDLVASRARAMDLLRELIEGVEGVRLPEHDRRADTVAHYSVTLRYDAEAFSGLAIETAVAYLKAEGIPCAAEWKLPYDRASAAGIDLGPKPAVLLNADLVHSETIVLPGYVLDADDEALADIAKALRKIQAAR